MSAPVRLGRLRYVIVFAGVVGLVWMLHTPSVPTWACTGLCGFVFPFVFSADGAR